MFEELEVDELMLVDGGFSWKWLAVAAAGVVTVAGGVLTGGALAAVSGPLWAGMLVDGCTIIAAGLTGYSTCETCISDF